MACSCCRAARRAKHARASSPHRRSALRCQRCRRRARRHGRRRHHRRRRRRSRAVPALGRHRRRRARRPRSLVKVSITSISVFFGNALRARHVERAAGAIDAVIARAQRPAAPSMSRSRNRRHRRARARRFGRNREAPEHGLRKRVFNRLAFGRVLAARSERLIGLHQHDPRARFVGTGRRGPAALAAIEADVVRPEARPTDRREQEVGVEPRNLDEQCAARSSQ